MLEQPQILHYRLGARRSFSNGLNPAMGTLKFNVDAVVVLVATPIHRK